MTEERRIPVTEEELSALENVSTLMLHSWAAVCFFWSLALVCFLLGMMLANYTIVAAAGASSGSGTIALWLNRFYRRSLKNLSKQLRERSSR